jgi:Mannitol repressor
MARSKLRDLSRLQLERDDFLALTDAFFSVEHPIVRAILGAGIVEQELEQLLRSKLKHKDDETWGMLIAENGPLNTFSSKIAMGYALGIYDKATYSDLTIVRNIRNAFAHSKKLIQFDHPAVVKELRKATRSALPKKYWKWRAEAWYVTVCYMLSRKLYRIHVRQLKSARYRLGRKIKAMDRAIT